MADDGAEKENEKRETRVSLLIGACVGSVLFGVSIPVALVSLSCGRHGVTPFGSAGPIRPWSEVLGNWVIIELMATLLCAPGAIVLTNLLRSHCRDVLRRKKSPRAVHWSGMLTGSMLAFLNFPAYGAYTYIEDQSHPLLKLALLFIIAGATSGIVVSWQAWREVNPDEGYWPRFSLGSLMIAVIAWGALLAVFAPE